MKHCNTHKAVIFYLFKTPPSYFKKSDTKFCIYSNCPPPTRLEKSLRAWCVENCNTHKIVFLCLFKTPPPTKKKSALNFVITYSKRPLLFQKKRLLPPKTERSHSTPVLLVYRGGSTQPPHPDNPDL